MRHDLRYTQDASKKPIRASLRQEGDAGGMYLVALYSHNSANDLGYEFNAQGEVYENWCGSHFMDKR